MLYEIVKDFVKNIKNSGEFSTKVLCLTTPTWKFTTNNPYIIITKIGRKNVSITERVKKLTYFNNNAMIGGYYVRQVFNQLDKIGYDNTQWVKEGLNGVKWEHYPYILKGIENPNQKYLRLTLRLNTTRPQSIYFLDGKLVTDANVVEDIRKWEKHDHSEKQMRCGIDTNHLIQPLMIKMENLIYLSQSGQSIGDSTPIKTYFQ